MGAILSNQYSPFIYLNNVNIYSKKAFKEKTKKEKRIYVIIIS